MKDDDDDDDKSITIYQLCKKESFSFKPSWRVDLCDEYDNQNILTEIRLAVLADKLALAVYARI